MAFPPEKKKKSLPFQTEYRKGFEGGSNFKDASETKTSTKARQEAPGDSQGDVITFSGND